MTTGDRVDDIYVIDAHLYGSPGRLLDYLVVDKEIALIDGGPATSVPTVLAGIKKIGVAPEDISYLVVNHIHPDHSWGAGIILKEMPKAKVLVHPTAAGDLIDPSMMVSNEISKGPGMSALERWGQPVPIPSSRVESVNDGDVIDLGGEQRLKAIYAPGHATSQLAIYEEKGKGLFVGDALGFFWPEKDMILIPNIPGADMRQAMDTVSMLMGLQVRRLFFSSFGVTTKVKEVLELSLAKMHLCWDSISKAMQDGKPEDVPNRYRAAFSSELEWLRLRDPYLYKRFSEALMTMWSQSVMEQYQRRQR